MRFYKDAVTQASLQKHLYTGSTHGILAAMPLAVKLAMESPGSGNIMKVFRVASAE